MADSAQLVALAPLWRGGGWIWEWRRIPGLVIVDMGISACDRWQGRIYLKVTAGSVSFETVIRETGARRGA